MDDAFPVDDSLYCVVSGSGGVLLITSDYRFAVDLCALQILCGDSECDVVMF